MTRTAISPRLAISIFFKGKDGARALPASARKVDVRATARRAEAPQARRPQASDTLL
jgi:hypothetical protein